MKILISIISMLMLAACTTDGDGILPTDESHETRTDLCMPAYEGKDLHTILQGEWTRDDITFVGNFIFGGDADCYMTITSDTMYLYSLHRGVCLDWNNETDGERSYITISDTDTIPYAFQDPNLLITEPDTFTVYVNKEDSAYYLIGKQRNFKLTTFR